MSESGSRLERAAVAWLRHRERGGTLADLLAAHPDLGDLLAAMAADGEENADPLSPARVLGDFQILREVGRGGMGVIYEARQLTLDRRVALKVLRADVSDNPAALARLRREALALARLHHPHIVGIYDVGATEGVHWLAMEFIEGLPLDRHLQELREGGGHAAASLRTLVQVIAQIAAALDHAHAGGFVHRDVKPSNIILRADGSAVLTDFGLARDETAVAITAVGAVAGTPQYMSPEQVQGLPLDARSDVFSLGAVLYECLTLQSPFAADSMRQVLHRILTQEPRDPRRLSRGLPADLAAITVQALAKEPSRRYQQASALAADLVAFLELRPVSVRAATTWQRAARACRREPGKAALVGAVAVAIPVVAGLLGYLWARRGVLDAGEVALRDAAVDDLLARGFAKLYAPKRDPSCRADFAAAAKLDALRPEVALGHALVAYNFETMADAVAVLDAQPPALQAVKGVQRLRAYFAHAEAGGEPTAAAAEASAPPTDAFDHLVAGFVAYELARARGDRAGFTAAATTLARGERLWPRPSVVHLMQWVVTAIRVGEPEGIRDALDAIDTLFPHIAASSASVINHPDPARALAAAKRCVALEPRDPLWRYNLASRLHKTGDAQAALLEIEAALALDPDHLLASIQRTTILAALGRDGEALAAIEGVVRRHPDSGEAWNNLGTLRARAQQYEPALTAMREAVRLLPDSATASAKLAKLLRLTGRDQEAVAEEARFPKQ